VLSRSNLLGNVSPSMVRDPTFHIFSVAGLVIRSAAPPERTTRKLLKRAAHHSPQQSDKIAGGCVAEGSKPRLQIWNLSKTLRILHGFQEAPRESGPGQTADQVPTGRPRATSRISRPGSISRLRFISWPRLLIRLYPTVLPGCYIQPGPYKGLLLA
jgi:hypothetical protein